MGMETTEMEMEGGLDPSAELRAGSTWFGRDLIILQYCLSLACLLLLQ